MGSEHYSFHCRHESERTLKLKTELKLFRNPALRSLTVYHSRTSPYGRLTVHLVAEKAEFLLLLTL